MTPLRAVEAFLGLAESAFMALANILLAVMLAINFANITSRLLFDVGLIWVFPVTGVLFVWVVFFSFFVIYRRGQDVAIDVLTRRMPTRLRAATEAFVALVVVGLMGIVIAQAPVLLPRQVGVMDLVGIQRYWLSVPFFLSCLLIAMEFLLKLRGAVLAMAAPHEGQDQHP